MPTPLPDNWPTPSPNQILPAIYVTLPDLGTMAVGSWSLERELQGAVLPGNVRAASGISIGSGSATVAGATPEGVIRSPWSKAARVLPGGDAQWFAAYDGPDSTDRVPLGDWQLSPYSGSLASPASMSVDLVEKQFVGTSALNRVGPSGDAYPDPIFLVDQLARQIGYYSTPKPPESCIFSLPLAGGFWAEVGTIDLLALGSDTETWLTQNGRVAYTGQWGLQATCSGTTLSDSYDVYITLDTTDEVQFTFGDGLQLPVVAVDPTINTLYARATSDGSTVSGPFVPGADPVRPSRVQLHVQRTGTPGDWTGVNVRARSAAMAPWSAWVSIAGASSTDVGTELRITAYIAAIVSGIIVTTADEPGVWDYGNASLAPLGGSLATPWIDGTLDAWTALQQIVAAWAGAAWVTTDGRLTVRSRDGMAGIGTASTPIDVGASVEDIPWSIDPADTADRLELTYWPVDTTYQAETPSNYGPIAWSAEDAIELPPGQTTVVSADVDAYFWPMPEVIAGFASWTPAWNDSSLYPNWFSVYGACTTRDGTGAHPDYGVVGFKTVQVSTGRIEIHITNPTSSTLYTVDANGSPCLFLACNGAYRQNTSSTVARGLPVAEATNPLTIDLGRYVQNEADAEALADFIWGRVSAPMWKASSVRVALDWSRDIGDVYTLTHERSGLSQRAITTKVAYDGAPGQVTQSLDLVLLPPTWADWDAAWAGKTWTAFDAEWSGDSWTDFDNDPLRST